MKWENSKAFYHSVSLTSLTSNDLWKPNLKTEEQIMQDKGFAFWIKQREQRQYGSRSLGKFVEWKYSQEYFIFT